MKLRRLLVPRWKIRRELRSLREQIAALPEVVVGPLRKLRADRRFPHDLRIVDGAAPSSAKIAIYLTFQPQGMAESTLSACRHLAGGGYAVLLVANAPIADADRERLAPHVWRFVQRVNFGYDFGGYRDGLRLIQHWQLRPTHLIVLNDSIWFPLYPDEELIARMEGSPSGFVGAQRYVDHLDDLDERTGILMSFFFLFKAALLESPEFRRFWRSYVPSSSKVLTVKRGERRFSRQLIARGQTGDGIYSPVRFLRAMAGQSAEFLAKTLDYAAYTDADLEAQGAALLAEQVHDEGWRRRVLLHLRAASERRNFCSVFPYASIKGLAVPFLKKNRAELQLRMRRQFLRAVAAGDLPQPAAEMLREIQARVA